MLDVYRGLVTLFIYLLNAAIIVMLLRVFYKVRDNAWLILILLMLILSGAMIFSAPESMMFLTTNSIREVHEIENNYCLRVVSKFYTQNFTLENNKEKIVFYVHIDEPFYVNYETRSLITNSIYRKVHDYRSDPVSSEDSNQELWLTKWIETFEGLTFHAPKLSMDELKDVRQYILSKAPQHYEVRDGLSQNAEVTLYYNRLCPSMEFPWGVYLLWMLVFDFFVIESRACIASLIFVFITKSSMFF